MWRHRLQQKKKLTPYELVLQDMERDRMLREAQARKKASEKP